MIDVGSIELPVLILHRHYIRTEAQRDSLVVRTLSNPILTFGDGFIDITYSCLIAYFISHPHHLLTVYVYVRSAPRLSYLFTVNLSVTQILLIVCIIDCMN